MKESDTAGEVRLVVAIGPKRYAFPVKDVEGVLSIRRSDVSDVPFDVSGRLRGVFLDHGSVVPLVRRAGMLAASDTEENELLTVVALQDRGRRLALVVDRAEMIAGADDSVCFLSAHDLYTGVAKHGDD